MREARRRDSAGTRNELYDLLQEVATLRDETRAHDEPERKRARRAGKSRDESGEDNESIEVIIDIRVSNEQWTHRRPRLRGEIRAATSRTPASVNQLNLPTIDSIGYSPPPPLVADAHDQVDNREYPITKVAREQQFLQSVEQHLAAMAVDHYYMVDWFAETLSALARQETENRELIAQFKNSGRSDLDFDVMGLAQMIQNQEHALRGFYASLVAARNSGNGDGGRHRSFYGRMQMVEDAYQHAAKWLTEVAAMATIPPGWDAGEAAAILARANDVPAPLGLEDDDAVTLRLQTAVAVTAFYPIITAVPSRELEPKYRGRSGMHIACQEKTAAKPLIYADGQSDKNPLAVIVRRIMGIEDYDLGAHRPVRTIPNDGQLGSAIKWQRAFNGFVLYLVRKEFQNKISGQL
ncbi:hypothetical protein DFH09DRAFT_1091653 [Mycena vulgaris]|nr:hypothetical protein DFH09DRAFT_1091653 [Mycena vulgaris]